MPTSPYPHAILQRLQEALSAEHGAIVRLLRHAYQSGGLGIGAPLEGIARHEMRQFKWLAEAIVAGGGNPDLVARPEHAEEGSDPCAWLRHDVFEAEAAMARYVDLADASGAVPDARDAASLRAMAGRLAQDERDQREKLLKLLGALEAAERHEVPAVEGEPHDPATAAMLDAAITHEYEVILQYLQHAYTAKDAAVTRTLEDVAVEEMRHLGWLTESRAGRPGGGCPFWKAKRVDFGTDALSMLEADEAREMEVVGDYASAAQATEDSEAKALFTMLQGHEAYHGQVLGRLIGDLRESAGETSLALTGVPSLPAEPLGEALDLSPVKQPPRPTVGTLLGQAQP